jgi:hypothetical protein
MGGMLETLSQKAMFGNRLCEIGNEDGKKTTYCQVMIDAQGGGNSSKYIFNLIRNDQTCRIVVGPEGCLPGIGMSDPRVSSCMNGVHRVNSAW